MISNVDLYKTLRSAYDAEACADAMQEWLEDQARTTEKLLNDIVAVSTDEDLVVEDSIEWWTNLIESLGYRVDMPIQLIDEYYTLGSLFRSAYYSGAGSLITDEGEVMIPPLTPLFPDDDPTTGLARLRDVGTDVIKEGASFTMETMDQVYSSVKSSIHSVLSLAGTLAASKLTSVADRLSYFRDYVTRTFSNPYSDISNAAHSLTQLLESTTGPADILQNLSSYLGADGLNTETAYSPVSNSDAYKFSGAVPIASLNFGVAKSAFLTTIRAAANVVGNVCVAIVAGVKNLFRKVEHSLNTLALNPNDIAVRNESAKYYCVDGLHCPSATSSDNFWLGATPQALAASDLEGLDIPDTFAIESWFGKLIMTEVKVNSVDTWLGTSGVRGKAASSWTPFFINVHAFISEVMSPTSVDGEAGWDGGVHFMDRLKKFSTYGDIYLHPDTDIHGWERTMLGGLLASSVIAKFLLSFDRDENSCSITWTAFEDLYTRLLKLDGIGGGTWCDLPDTVTNEDFFAAATGITKSNDPAGVEDFDLVNGHIYYRSKSNDLKWTSICYYPTFSDGVAFIVYNRTQKRQFPTSYPFCPYTTTKVIPPDGKFYIKTDEQNAQAFNTFINAAVIVAILAVATVAIGVTLKVKANHAKLVLSGAQRNYENILANPNATPEQVKAAKKVYKRAKLKSKILGSASSGMQSTASQMASSTQTYSNDIDASYLTIKTLITGEH